MTGPVLDLQALEVELRPLLQAGRGREVEMRVRPLLTNGAGPVALWALLAQALRVQGRVQEARPIQEMLVDALPGHVSTRFDLSETLLLLGEFDRGWREYSHRYSLAHTTRIERKVQRPRWDGRAIPGQTLLIHDEQGYGDTFQFMRMVGWAKARSQATVVLEINHDTALRNDELAARDGADAGRSAGVAHALSVCTARAACGLAQSACAVSRVQSRVPVGRAPDAL
jgi:hypothetical protein